MERTMGHVIPEDRPLTSVRQEVSGDRSTRKPLLPRLV